MPLNIVRQDITRIKCDAIVNATDPCFSGSGGVDAAIHKAAGEELSRECARLGGCPPGKARLTGAYGLPCKYVIHTVGPVWHGGNSGEEETLRSCYREALKLADSRGCESVAFPPIASESLGYPKEQAIRIASEEILRFLEDHDMQVTLVVFGRECFDVSKSLFAQVAEFIDQNYVDVHRLDRSQLWRPYSADGMPERETYGEVSSSFDSAPFPMQKAPRIRRSSAPKADIPSLTSMLKDLDESFSQMLLRKIDEKGMTDAQCYKKANIDRKLFSKIRNDVHYRPSKTTAVAFAIALELPLDEARSLLEKAGFALSRSSIFDVIIEFFIRSRNYNIFEINEVLFSYDQSLLGG